MRFSLFSTLLICIPLSFLLMGVRPWVQFQGPVQWEAFQVDALEKERAKNRDVLVFVNSVYGLLGGVLDTSFTTDVTFREAVATEKIVAMRLDFKYVTRAPEGLEYEYGWVYDQGVSCKESFFVLYRGNGEVTYYQGLTKPDEVLSELGIVNLSTIHFWLAWITSIAVGVVLLFRNQKQLVSKPE